MKKGMELPINMLVVVAVAVVVLMGVIAIYILGVGPFQQSVGLEAIKNSACSLLVREGCTASTSGIHVNTDANEDGFVCTKNIGYNAKTGIGYDEDTDTCLFADDGENEARKPDTLLGLCASKFGKTSDSACKALCNCPGYY
ncbi:MAG: hypothetical protein KJ697_04300 [Nanoarchaeota archaeon]|nr:hypothetical protein [Nanoarchaeota archaeon]